VDCDIILGEMSGFMKKLKLKIKVNQEKQDLMECFRERGIAKNKVKTYVKCGFVLVNGKVVSKLPIIVRKNDEILLDVSISNNSGLDIVYEDKNYLIVNKIAGLLSISTSNVNRHYEETLYRLVREYLNKKKEMAFIVNRIDKETSGLVVFVKNEELKQRLQECWNEIVKKRGYIAVVSGQIKNKGRIDNYLYEDKQTFSHSTKVGGKRAITNYRPIKGNDKYTMLDINIETGRKNQIRVHMSEMNHPIVGDKKYYSKDNCLGRLALHHYEISFVDPVSGKLLEFKKEVPDEFYSLFN